MQLEYFGDLRPNKPAHVKIEGFRWNHPDISLSQNASFIGNSTPEEVCALNMTLTLIV